jgi:DNA-binding response OmpR family regulator
MKKILILNNDEDTMSLIKGYLIKHSYQAEYMYRAEGNSVIEKIKKYKPDVVVLESSIGEEGPLCQRIKSDGSSNMRVILLGGNISSNNELINCGADDIIAKPFVPQTLLQKIDKLCGNSND